MKGLSKEDTTNIKVMILIGWLVMPVIFWCAWDVVFYLIPLPILFGIFTVFALLKLRKIRRYKERGM